MRKNADSNEEEELYPLMTCEAFYVLDDRRSKLINNRMSKQYIKLFDSALNYAETCSRVTSRSRAETLRNVLSKFELSNAEISSIGSLFPQSVDEAKMLIPSLSRFGDEALSTIIKHMDDF